MFTHSARPVGADGSRAERVILAERAVRDDHGRKDEAAGALFHGRRRACARGRGGRERNRSRERSSRHQSGTWTFDSRFVTCLTRPLPSAFTTAIRPGRTKTILRPSGDQSGLESRSRRVTRVRPLPSSLIV